MIITGGEYKGRKISAPDEKITRPTLSKVRMGIFNTLFSMVGNFESLTFLDLFGGSGIMGIEALSRGFKEVFVCEKNPKAIQIIKKNYEALGLHPNIYLGDSLKFLKTTEKIFDIVYVDPPYQSGIYEEVFCELKNSGSIIVAEHSETLAIKDFTPLKTKNYGGKFLSFYK